MLVNNCFVNRLKERILEWFRRSRQTTPTHTPRIPPNKAMLKPFKATMPRGKNRS